METKMEKRFDDYVFYTADESEFLTEISEMEKNSVWMPGIPRTALTVLPWMPPCSFRKPWTSTTSTPTWPVIPWMMPAQVSHLMVQYQGQTWCLRDTGRMTLYTSAGQIGPANGNMVKAEAYSDLAKSMNLGLKYAKGNALLLIRYGKLSALHSGASDGYCVMPISELLAATKNALNKRFGVPQFKEGSNSHSYTSAIWELPDVQSELVNKYQQALSTAVSRNHSANWMPMVRFSTSDTATSSAVLMPKLKPSSGGYAFCIGKGIRVEHMMKTSGQSMGWRSSSRKRKISMPCLRMARS